MLDKSFGRYHFPDGITVAELKAVLATAPETDPEGRPLKIRVVTDGSGWSNIHVVSQFNAERSELEILLDGAEPE